MINPEKMQLIAQEFENCSGIFVALGDKVRQKLILDIVNSGIEGINVQNLAAKTHLSRPAISHHLKILKDSGLIVPVKKGTQIFYRVRVIEKLWQIHQLGSLITEMVKGLDEESKEVMVDEDFRQKFNL